MQTTELEKLRKKIDQIDHDILSLLHERISQVILVAQTKKETGKEIYDPEREQIMMGIILKQAKTLGLNEDFIKNIWSQILADSRKQQKEEL